MDHYLTKSNDDMDIWRMTSPGYCIHIKRVRGDIKDLMDNCLMGPIGVVRIARYIIATSSDLVELEGKAALECLEEIPWGARTLKR